MNAKNTLAVVPFALVCAMSCRPQPNDTSPPPSGDGSVSNTPAQAPTKSDRVGVVTQEGELPVSAAQEQAGIPYLRFKIDIDGAPTRGPEDAPVTIVMFSDFECPFCVRGLETVEKLEEEYAGKIRFAYKAFPIDRHPNALRAALVAHSAQEQGKFWSFHDLLFSGRGLDPETITEFAARVGLDSSKVEAELDELTHAPAVSRDIRQARRFDVSSTPAFFVNGRYVKGAKPIQIFRHLIDQELSLAQRWNEEGIADVYEHVTKFAYTSVTYEGARQELDEGLVYPVPLGDSPQRGPKDAPLTVVVFADFQCPYCATGHETLDALRERYGDQMRIVFKHFPLPGHPQGVLASRASYFAAEHGKFWEFHDAVYALGARIDVSDLERIAEELKLPLEGFRAAMQGDSHDKRIMADLELGTALGVTGTPTYFVNGRPLGGARPALDFRMLFVEELKRADELRAEGVPKDELYPALAGLDAAAP